MKLCRLSGCKHRDPMDCLLLGGQIILALTPVGFLLAFIAALLLENACPS